jgi:hypothetical protein
MASLINQTTTVQQVMDVCKLHTKLQNFFNVGGISGQPGRFICETTNQMLLAFPNAWKWNRQELSGTDRGGSGNFFVTQYGFQDYLHAGACCFSLLNSQAPNNNSNFFNGGVSIDLATNAVNNGQAFGALTQTSGITVTAGVVTVQFLQPHPGFQIGQTIYMSGNGLAAYNSLLTFNATLQTSTWTGGFVITAVPDQWHIQFAKTASMTNGDTTGAPGITNWGWIESAYFTDINSTQFPIPTIPLIAVKRLPVTYYPTGDRWQVAMLLDNNNGILKFRLSEPPGTYNYQVNTVYQARAPKLQTAQSVVQWPDNVSFAFIEAALAQAYRFATGISSNETTMQRRAAAEAIMMARAADDEEDVSEGIIPDIPLMRPNA